MKERDAHVDFDKHLMTVFVEKDDGTYGAIETGSYMVKNYYDDFQKKMKHFRTTALNQLKNNEISPVAFYMILREMGAGDVAARVGVSTAKVKKHMKTEYFGNISLKLARRYADVFGVEVAQLFQIPTEDTLPVRPVKTNNPYVIILDKTKEEA